MDIAHARDKKKEYDLKQKNKRRTKQNKEMTLTKQNKEMTWTSELSELEGEKKKAEKIEGYDLNDKKTLLEKKSAREMKCQRNAREISMGCKIKEKV